VEMNTINDTSTQPWAALPAACSAWAINLSAPGANHALGQQPALSVGNPLMRSSAFRPDQVPTSTKQIAATAGEPLAVNGTPKQNDVYKTRINAGGYGAMGPHPEREPA
jgi:hypothetical protein